MSDTIYRQDAIDAIYEHEFSNWCDKDEVSTILNDLPSAQRKGRINIRSNMLDGEDCYCSECDHWGLLPDYKFCPYCGVEFEDVISECHSMEEFMYGQDMGNPEDGSL